MRYAALTSTAGMLVEIVGFAVLTYGVWQSHQDNAGRLSKLLAQLSRDDAGIPRGLTFDRIVAYAPSPGESGGGCIVQEGGFTETVAKVIADMQAGSGEVRSNLFAGAGLTGIGLALQILGTWL